MLALAPDAARGQATFDVQALGGYRAFVSDAGDVLEGGPAYRVGVTVGLARWLAIEGWYEGATFDTESGLTIGDRRTRQNGVAGVLRLGPTVGQVRPYAFGGAEWDWFRAEGTNTVVRDEEFLTVPLGAGIDVNLSRNRSSGLKLGARGAYRLGFGEDAFVSGSTMDRTDQFEVAAVLGAQF